ncbi:M16 family metallopeptidase [Hymenobacter latericus]|uniref:M16 family metallopeptidase n=1 Tax=Hymenobacter sp. YIM 151858-1 TaxID=2987688 RepID=UPI002225F887|nr:pitrilysin family protein [Hymenobacter sp. YIM 151858-1]UYZ57746.1 insulinase family protein [Hymenobacter sp. YIM 151858-1]
MLNRQLAPPTRPIGRVDLPKATVTQLPNGARLHVLPHNAQPVVRLQVVLPAGRWYDPTPGVSLLTARTLLDGTHSRTARQIADEVAFYGASLECEQGFDRATLTLYCLSRHLEKLLPLVQDVLINASFPDSDVEQLKLRTIQNIRVERQKTSYLASERFSQNLFGPKHPYGRVFNEDSFRTLSPDDARSFHHEAYNLGKAELFLCGDVNESHINILQELLGTSGKPSANGAIVEFTNDFTPIPADYVAIEGSLQASLRLGRAWPTPSHADTHKLQFLVKVLGGYFGSRLMKNIREDKGFTYGIYASINHREHGSNLIIASDVNAQNAEAAIQEIHHEMRTLQEEAIPEEELETVRSYILGKFLNELGTIFEQADKYKTRVLLGLHSDFHAQFIAEVSAVTADELRALAQGYLAPAGLAQAVAGPTAR